MSVEQAEKSSLNAGARIAGIDVIRGLALLGVVFVNLQATSGVWGKPTQGIDRLIENGTNFFIYGSSYAVFAMLFGAGFAIQMSRSPLSSFSKRYLRRVALLFMIGVVHYVAIWHGDILQTYGLVGLMLLLFRPASSRTALALAAVALAIVIFYSPIEAAVLDLRSQAGIQAQPAGADEQRAEVRATYRKTLVEGSYRDVVDKRIRRLKDSYDGHGWYANRTVPYVFSMFCIGVFAWVSGLLRGRDNLPIGRIFVSCAVVGLVGNSLIVAAAELDKAGADNPVPTLVMSMAEHVGNPALGFAYITGTILLLKHGVWQRWLAPFGAVGRMALTNYILQSLVFTTIFYGYGLGLSGKISYLQAAILSVVVYAVQIPLSVSWLRRYQYGPVEYAWRAATYGRLSRMRGAAS